ncbi:MAG TPA: VOC family protein [Acidimicrobiia bacterium]|nr:VOC family protein [Acidimicrobiia bacterium]
MEIIGFDHIVLCVRDVEAAVSFYREVVGLDAREERPGKWSLHFGDNKISLQDAASPPEMARGTLPGTGNFCLVTETPVGAVAERLRDHGVEILTGPVEKVGAIGPLMSVYFRDLDGNLVEISNRV